MTQEGGHRHHIKGECARSFLLCNLILVEELALLRLEPPSEITTLRIRHYDAKLPIVLETLSVFDYVGVFKRAQNSTLLAR